MTITEGIQKLERVADNLDAIIVRAINETESDFIKLNEEQWAEGTFNRKIPGTTTPYSAPYAKVRQKKGLQTAFVDFKFTGELYKRYKIDIGSKGLKLSSDVDYEKDLTKRFGEDMWGLTDENLVKYRAILAPFIQRESKLQFNG
jgi:hypothetical protein